MMPGMRLTGSLIGAMGVTLIFCMMAPLMSRTSVPQVLETVAPVRIFPLPEPVKVLENQIIIPKKTIPLSGSPRKEKLRKKAVRPENIQLRPLEMETVPLMAATLPTPLPAAPEPVLTKTMATDPGGADVFQVASVDVQPRLKRYRPPLYPPRARGQGVEGKVVVRCVVSAGGKVKDAKIIKVEPVGYFERAALKAVKKWTFVPAKLNGEKVPVYVDIPLSFTLDR